jgi:hypothetical protein
MAGAASRTPAPAGASAVLRRPAGSPRAGRRPGDSSPVRQQYPRLRPGSRHHPHARRHQPARSARSTVCTTAQAGTEHPNQANVFQPSTAQLPKPKHRRIQQGSPPTPARHPPGRPRLFETLSRPAAHMPSSLTYSTGHAADQLDATQGVLAPCRYRTSSYARITGARNQALAPPRERFAFVRGLLSVTAASGGQRRPAAATAGRNCPGGYAFTGRRPRGRRRRCRWRAGPGCRGLGHTGSWCADLHERRLLVRRAAGLRRPAQRL